MRNNMNNIHFNNEAIDKSKFSSEKKKELGEKDNNINEEDDNADNNNSNYLTIILSYI